MRQQATSTWDAHQIAAAAVLLVIIEIVAILAFALGSALLGMVVDPQHQAHGAPGSDADTLIYFSFSAFTTVRYRDVILLDGQSHAMAAPEALLSNACHAIF